jgi:CHAT domain-containing protein
VAGARTTILSLWPVEDVSTQRFMTALYRARWSSKRSTAEAMRDASLSLLERKGAGRSGHPFHWAGFVAVGDWR